MKIDEINDRVFAKIGQEKLLHEYQQIVFQLIGVVIDFINAAGESLKLSLGRNFNPICSALRGTQRGNELCHHCDITHATTAAATKQPLVYTCHAGFTELLVPLFDNGGKYIGSMTTGQFLVKGQKKMRPQQLENLALQLGLNPQHLKNLSRQTKTLTQTQLQGLIGYLQIIGQQLVGTHNHLMYMESINAPDKVKMIQRYIEENYQKKLTVTSMAQKFYLSPNYFSRFFRTELGVNFNAYLNAFRIRQAKDMLQDTSLTISEICRLTGFGSIAQFNRVFRNLANMSPRDYRKDLLNSGSSTRRTHRKPLTSCKKD